MAVAKAAGLIVVVVVAVRLERKEEAEIARGDHDG